MFQRRVGPPGDEDATEGKQKITQRGCEQFTPAMGAVPTCAFTITRHQFKVTGPQLGLAVRAEKVFEAHAHIVRPAIKNCYPVGGSGGFSLSKPEAIWQV